jgi:hypothetical protein
VRPDHHVAFRHMRATPGAEALLGDAMARILGLQNSEGGRS